MLINKISDKINKAYFLFSVSGNITAVKRMYPVINEAMVKAKVKNHAACKSYMQTVYI